MLAPHHRVLIPDLPGYGASPPLADSSMEAVGMALATELGDRGITSLRAVVGFSTGAYRGFELLLHHKITADVVVSLSGMVALDDSAAALRHELGCRLASDSSFIDSPDVHAMMRQLMLAPSWLATHPEDGDLIMGWLRLTTPRALAAELLALAAMRDLGPELARLEARVYARVGELDLGCPPAYSETIARRARRASLDLVPGCGHALLIEDRVATTAAIRDAIELGR
jgi:pimeloyl-ACP methyl ester carboxylesterase